MKRNLARLILVLVTIAWAVISMFVLVTPVKADAVPSKEPKEDDGRLPGDDVPATERCYMTAEEIQEDFPELVAIEPNCIQIEWDAFSALFPNDANLESHFINGDYEHKRGWYNGVYIVTCREVKPDEA